MEATTAILLASARGRASMPAAYAAKIPPSGAKSVRIAGNDESLLLLELRIIGANDPTISKVMPHAAEALSFQIEAYNVLKSQGHEAFADLYTENSREKYLKWLKSVDPNYLANYSQRKTVGRKPVLVVDAAPFFFVFCRLSDGSLEIDDIFRNPSDGRLMLTNFFYEDYIHSLLKDGTVQRAILKCVEP